MFGPGNSLAIRYPVNINRARKQTRSSMNSKTKIARDCSRSAPRDCPSLLTLRMRRDITMKNKSLVFTVVIGLALSIGGVLAAQESKEDSAAGLPAAYAKK